LRCETESALIVEVPAAEPVVGRHRSELDANARLGIPAHITVLAPFMPTSRLGAEERARLGSLLSAVQAFDFELDRTDWFGTTVLWLAPQDPAPFRRLTDAVFAAFPDFPPFEGRFDDVVPHLTVGFESPVEALRRAERDITSSLPVLGRADAVTLMHELSPGGRWEALASFPLGSASLTPTASRRQQQE
jgi:2'-5' RNA ligase superfamily